MMEKIKKQVEVGEINLGLSDTMTIDDLIDILKREKKDGITHIDFTEEGTYSCGDYESDTILMTTYSLREETDEEFEYRKSIVEARLEQERLAEEARLEQERAKANEKIQNEKKKLKELMKKYPDVKPE